MTPLCANQNKRFVINHNRLFPALIKLFHTKAQKAFKINDSNETIKQLKYVLYNKSNEYDNKAMIKHAFTIYNKDNKNINDTKYHSDLVILMLKIFLNSHNPE
eukprot:82049_1